jgi:hypothetical protein
MNTNEEYEDMDLSEGQEEALTEAEAPGEVVDPLAEPAGSRGTQRMVVTEYDEEDARERPPEDGLNPEVPEDQNLHVSESSPFEDELEDAPPTRGNSAEMVEGE